MNIFIYDKMPIYKKKITCIFLIIISLSAGSQISTQVSTLLFYNVLHKIVTNNAIYKRTQRNNYSQKYFPRNFGLRVKLQNYSVNYV